MKDSRTFFVLALALSLVLAACGSTGGKEDPEPKGPTVLIYANLIEGGVDREAVSTFNRTHDDVQIEVRDYFDEDGVSGKDRLFTEIGAGKVPDIIDLGLNKYDSGQILPYRMMVEKGLLEDLWPYIENDPDLGRDSLLEAPLKAAEIGGGLYFTFNKVRVSTLVGAESMVGDRNSWTLAELREAFSHMPEDSTILRWYDDKTDAFSGLFRMDIDSYVDWETGECFFNGDRFKTALEFVNSLPDPTINWSNPDEVAAANEERDERQMKGLEMLAIENVCRPLDIQQLDAEYGQGGNASFIGYPVEDGSVGSCFEICGGSKFGMSSTCRDKEAAWEFIRQVLLPQCKKEKDLFPDDQGLVFSFPINLSDYDLLRKADQYRKSISATVLPGGVRLELHNATDEDVARFEDLINSVHKIELCDNEIYDIAYDVASAYFAGDKPLDEAANLIQNRVSLYVSENR